MIDCIYDTTPKKIGKLSPGTHILLLITKFLKNLIIKYLFTCLDHKKKSLKKKNIEKNCQWFTHLN